ncbi:hypothetical protein CEXT_388851 [Caerostris extrusa]|uniref:Uncharacterized protein n=1 Tax=Caerostris extrusa TaxID=172846 RepID=A0AAV4RIP8_CAEEX|nr:hypothetical protein CEXT_388851 [Caerostris extrusa]
MMKVAVKREEEFRPEINGRKIILAGKVEACSARQKGLLCFRSKLLKVFEQLRFSCHYSSLKDRYYVPKSRLDYEKILGKEVLIVKLRNLDVVIAIIAFFGMIEFLMYFHQFMCS